MGLSDVVRDHVCDAHCNEMTVMESPPPVVCKKNRPLKTIHSSLLTATTALLYQAYCGDKISAALLESYIRLFSNKYNT